MSNVDTAKTEFKKSGKVCPKLRNSKCEFGFRVEKCPDLMNIQKFAKNSLKVVSLNGAATKKSVPNCT